MEFWYLGALRAAEMMARENRRRAVRRGLPPSFEQGRAWTEANLFNGEYFEHGISCRRTLLDPSRPCRGHGTKDFAKPDYPARPGCLVDQLVGQVTAHICGLGYLADPAKVRRTLDSTLGPQPAGRAAGPLQQHAAFA